MKKTIAGILAAALCSTAAQAEPFSGPYIGVEGGIDSYDLSADLAGGDFDPELEGYRASFDGLSGDGLVAGGFIGYQRAFGFGFMSAEAFANINDASMSASFTDGESTTRARVEAKESYGVAARLGTRVNTSTGLYARAGWVHTRFKGSAFYSDPEGSESYSEGQTEDAIQYGAGLETMVAPKMALRLEYLRADYGEAGLAEGVGLDNNSIRAGMSFRF